MRPKSPADLHEAITDTRRLLAARKGPPTEADAPRRQSRPPRVLPGQIDIHGVTHDAPPTRRRKGKQHD